MLRVLSIALVLVAAAPCAAATDVAGAERDATVAGKAWLALVDAERYAESWDQASRVFRDKVGREQWVAMVRGARGGLGKLHQRSFRSARSTEVEGGQFIVLLWSSGFEGMSAVTGQVTMVLEDGSWRCAGYFVRPR